LPPNVGKWLIARVRSILVDIARTWDRWALNVAHSMARITPKQVLRHPAAQRNSP
jgi:hypothetical protein